MSMPINTVCEEIRQLLPEFWSGAVLMKEHARVETHLAGCAECRGESEYLASVWERLDLIPVEAPGPRLRARFYE